MLRLLANLLFMQRYFMVRYFKLTDLLQLHMVLHCNSQLYSIILLMFARVLENYQYQFLIYKYDSFQYDYESHIVQKTC